MIASFPGVGGPRGAGVLLVVQSHTVQLQAGLLQLGPHREALELHRDGSGVRDHPAHIGCPAGRLQT